MTQSLLAIITVIAACSILLSVSVTQTSFSLFNYDYIDTFGSFGISSSGHFSYPQFVAVSDDDGSIYVSDFGNKRVQKFSSAGLYLDQWGTSGTLDGQFHHPSGIALFNDTVFVADRNLNRVQKFTTDGEFVLEWGVRGSSDGQFLLPNGVAVHNGTVYVVDTGNQRIQKFTTDGEFISSFGSSGFNDGQFITPLGIDIDNDGHVYVTDRGSHSIEKFNLTGAFVSSFAFHAPGYTFTPEAVAVDPSGKMFVVNSANDRILHLSNSTMRLAVIDQLGPYPNSFGTVTDIAIGINGELIVVDSSQHAIKLYGTPFYRAPVATDIVTTIDAQVLDDQLLYANDTRDPLIMAPPSLTVEATDMKSIVPLGEALAVDDSGIRTIINNAPESFDVGTTSVLWIAFDNAGNSAQAYQTVTVLACGSSYSDYNIVLGTEGNDVLSGTDGADLMFGLGGNDVISGNDGNDCIYGGEGNDVISGNSGDDTIRGNSGDDIIKGNAGSDTIYSNSGSDIIDGGSDSDTCNTDDSTNAQLVNCEA